MKVFSDGQKILELIGEVEKGVIFLDLNDTLIDDSTAAITVEAEMLQGAVKVAEQKGWRVGLCSDSPHDPLKDWGLQNGITGPVISENGLCLNGKQMFAQTLDVSTVKKAVQEWVVKVGLQMLPDVVAEEFGGSKPDGTGVAFGLGRICSSSLFCFRDGKPDKSITKQLEWFLRSNLNGVDLDSAPNLGNILIHAAGNFRGGKARMLNSIADLLQQTGKSCWMAGNSMSDVTGSQACQVAMVANASSEAKQCTILVAEQPFTAGVIELLSVIQEGGVV